jgi:RHS repeat-associated protein
MTKITNFVWNPVDDCIISELDQAGAAQAVYTHEPRHYGGVLSQIQGATTSTYHADALGTTRALTDSTGFDTDTYLNDAWGNSIASTGTTINPFKWIGKYGYYTDSSTAQVYVRARMFQPTVARWVSHDPLGFREGANLFVYASNSVLSFIDPAGTFKLPIHVAITRRALDVALGQVGSLAGSCKTKFINTIVCCNLSQDLNHFDDLSRHYNRPFPRWSDGDPINRAAEGRIWDAKYLEYLIQEEHAFARSLSEQATNGACGSSEGCCSALQSLGRLTHSWQDFFAHAVRRDQRGKIHINKPTPPLGRIRAVLEVGSENSFWPGFSAFADPTDSVIGDPINRWRFFPSSYRDPEDLLYAAEHPLLIEPVISGGPEDIARQEAAYAFTAIHSQRLLKEFFAKCDVSKLCNCCECECLLSNNLISKVADLLNQVPGYCKWETKR